MTMSPNGTVVTGVDAAAAAAAAAAASSKCAGEKRRSLRGSTRAELGRRQSVGGKKINWEGGIISFCNFAISITFAFRYINRVFPRLFSGMEDQPPVAQSRAPFERAYKVGDVLGKGGFGTVYAGIRVRDGRHVAIKHVARAKVTDWDVVSFPHTLFFRAFLVINVRYAFSFLFS